MFMRRIAFASFFVFAISISGSVLSATSAQANGTAQTFVEGMADEAVQALTAPGVSRDVRVARFRTLLNANFDVPLIGRWVLGRSWRKASDMEKAEYLTLFEDYIVVTYVERFDQYSGEKLNVLKSVADPGKDAIVYSEINRPSGDGAIRVNWRVRAKSDVYKIIDVYVEGISMSQTQRKEFASVIRSNGGKISALNDLLRNKIVQLNK